MYTDHRPLYYRLETWFRHRPVKTDFYIPFFYRYNQTYSYNPRKYGTALLLVTREPGERITWLTFGGPLFPNNANSNFSSHTELLPVVPLMEESRSRLCGILESQFNV